MTLKKTFFFILVSSILIILNNCSNLNNISIIEKGLYKKESQISSRTIKSKTITILAGDTLFTISKKYKVTNKELIKLNNLRSPYILKPGKKIHIPKALKYKIKKGDTLFKIARCYSISLKDIRIKNSKLIEKKLIINNIILIPYYSVNKCNKKDNKLTIKNNKSRSYSKIFSWPTKGTVITSYGKQQGGRRNDGINILSAKGNPVRAALEGKVIYRGNELPAWGNLILIKHKNNWTTAYAHLDKFLVKIGDNVKTGDIIGSVGATGNVKQYQLHFQVRRNSKPLNPIQYLK